MKKQIIQKEHVVGRKIPKTSENAISYLNKRPSWRFSRVDQEYEKWSVFTDGKIRDDILEKLKAYEGLTWSEIQNASGGKSKGHGNNNHFEYIGDLSKEAQQRCIALNLYEDQLFSLRLTGKSRLYGLVDDGVFTIIWYDNAHEIYPSNKKHT